MTIYDDPWNKDYMNFTGDIQKFIDAEKAETDAEALYHSQVVGHFNAIRDPILAIMYFLTVVAVAQNSDASLTGINDEKTCVLGRRLKVASDLSQLTNDLQNMTTNQTVTDADAKTILGNYAGHLNDLLNEFDTDDKFKKCFSDTSDMYIALRGNFLDLRHLVKTGDINGYDPTTETYYFVTGAAETGKFNSFEAMIKALGNKGNTDATAADKALTDSFSSASTSSGGINAAINEEVSLNTNYQKSLQSFVAQLMKDTKDVSQAAVSSQKVG